MTERSSSGERHVSMEGSEFPKYTPTKEDKERVEAIMSRLFTKVERYESLEDVVTRRG